MLPNGLTIALISLLQSTLLNVNSETSPVYLPTPCGPTPAWRFDDSLPASTVAHQAQHKRDLLTSALAVFSITLLVFLASVLGLWSNSGTLPVSARTSSTVTQSKSKEQAVVPTTPPFTIDLDDCSDSSDSSPATVKASTPETPYMRSPARDCLSPYYKVGKPKRLSAPCPKRKPLFDVFGPLLPIGNSITTKPATPPRVNIRGLKMRSSSQPIAFSPAREVYLSLGSPLGIRSTTPQGPVHPSPGSTAPPLQHCTNTILAPSPRPIASLETTYRQECVRLRSELSNAQSDRDFALREYDQLLRDLRDREERLNNSGRELKRRDKIIRQLQQEVDGYPEKVKALEDDLAKEQGNKTTELNQWKRQYGSQKAENVTLKSIVDDTRRMIKCKDDLIESLSRELERCAPKVKLLDIQLTDATRELEEALADLAEVKADNRSLIQSENDMEQTTFRTISKLESDLEVAQRDYKEHVQTLEKEIAKLQVVLRERHAFIQTMVSDEEEPTLYSYMHGGLARPLPRSRHRSSHSQ